MSDDTTRQAKHRARRQAAGWQIVHVMIPPDAAKCLAGMVAQGRTKAEAVRDALVAVKLP